MKKKTINAVISKKVKDWLNSITDNEVKNYISDKIIVTGGCITSMLLNEEINDFDIYFKDKKSVKFISEYYCNKFNDNNKDTPGQTGSSWNILNSNISYVPEDVANKATSTSLGTSDTLYPSQNAVKVYADTKAALAGSVSQAFSVSQLAIVTGKQIGRAHV